MFYYFTVLRFWQNKTDPANRQIWLAIQFTTNPLDGGDFKRLCHGRTFLFVAAPGRAKRAGFHFSAKTGMIVERIYRLAGRSVAKMDLQGGFTGLYGYLCWELL